MKKNILNLIIIFILWAVLIALRFLPAMLSQQAESPERNSAAIPVQTKLQAHLAGKLCRIADYQGQLPAATSGDLKASAIELLQEDLKQAPSSSYLLLRYALLLAHSQRTEEALIVIKRTPIRQQSDLTYALIFSWQKQSYYQQKDLLHQRDPLLVKKQVLSLIKQELSGYYQQIAIQESHCCPLAAQEIQQAKQAAQRDVILLTIFSGLISLCLVCALVFLFLLAKSYRLNRKNSIKADSEAETNTEIEVNNQLNKAFAIDSKESPAEISWLPIAILRNFVCLQWIAIALALAISGLMQYLSVTSITGLVVVQLMVYVLTLLCLAFLMPNSLAPVTIATRAIETKETASGESIPEDLPPLMAKKLKNHTFGQLLGINRPRLTHAFWGLAGVGLAIPLTSLAAWITSLLLGHSPFSSNQVLDIFEAASPSEWSILAVFVAFLGPCFEELIYRGYLFGGLRQSLSPWGAGLLSALMFSLAHGDPQGVLSLAVLGGVFAFMYQQSRSLWPAIITHGLWNGGIAALIALALLTD